MVSKKNLCMGAQKTLIQNNYEINVGQDSINIDFLGSNRQFDWLEISMVYDKSDRQTTIYDNYNIEIYSLTNEKKYDVDNLTQKHLLSKQFVAWACDGCSIAPLTDYINNPIYQELVDEDQYGENKSDKRVYLDLSTSSGYTNEAEKL